MRNIPEIQIEDVILGQFKRNGSKPGYLEGTGVRLGSKTPTFACAILKIMNQRWAGIPFVLKSGIGILIETLSLINYIFLIPLTCR